MHQVQLRPVHRHLHSDRWETWPWFDSLGLQRPLEAHQSVMQERELHIELSPPPELRKQVLRIDDREDVAFLGSFRVLRGSQRENQ